MTARRLTNILFTLLFLGVGTVASVFLYRDYQHFDNLRAENRVLVRQNAALEKDAAKRESQLRRLNADPEYIESVIRRKLNFSKDGETIFRFER